MGCTIFVINETNEIIDNILFSCLNPFERYPKLKDIIDTLNHIILDSLTYTDISDIIDYINDPPNKIDELKLFIKVFRADYTDGVVFNSDECLEMLQGFDKIFLIPHSIEFIARIYTNIGKLMCILRQTKGFIVFH